MIDVKLKVGDLVAFKKYEDITEGKRCGISEENFPEFGKVSEIFDIANCFKIEEESYILAQESIDHIINTNKGKINVGDEVLVKTTVRQVIGDHIWVSWIRTEDVVEVLERKEPERFIVQENHYGMYIGASLELVSDKIKAQGYASRDAAYQEASEMHLNAYEVIPYDN